MFSLPPLSPSFSLLAVALALATTCCAQHSAVVPEHIDVPAAGVTFPLQGYRGLPIVPVSINGKGPFPFILDTAANVTVLSEELTHELMLQPASGMHSSDGRVAAILKLEKIQAGGATLEGVIAAAMPLSNLLGDHARGVLSASCFPGYLVTLNYPGKLITIKKGSLGSADGQTTFAYDDSENIPSVPLKLAGYDARVHLDTGSTDGLSVPSAMLKIVPLASAPKEATSVKLVGREFPVSTALVKGPLEIGKYKLDAGEVRFSDARGGSASPAGTLGYLLLRDFVVTLDSKNRLIRFER